MITFSVPGQPQGKARPRFAKVGGCVRTYTPAQTASYESLIRLMYYRTGGKLHSGAIRLTVTAYYAIPLSWSKKRTQRAIGGLERPTVKPDADNVLKIVCDALNNAAYQDDKQIVSVECAKFYDKVPKVVITVEEISSERREEVNSQNAYAVQKT